MSLHEPPIAVLQHRLELRAEAAPPVLPRRVAERVRADGKFFRCGDKKWFAKGVTYGPFAPNADGFNLPERSQVYSDLKQIRELGGTAIRVYHAPPTWFLDDVAEAGLHVLVDVPWQKHRCFLEDYSAQRDAFRCVRAAAALGEHPAVFAISVANEVPKDIVRFYGERRIQRFIGNLLDSAKQRAPECLLTYTNYPSTEFLRPESIDFLCFNLYLEQPDRLGAYLDRLQHLAGTIPLVLGEHGMDSTRHGPHVQAQSLREQVRRVFTQGLAGSFVFSFTDDWFTGGAQVEDWAFGITDRQRDEKPAAIALREAWSTIPCLNESETKVPRVSVVVCSYNGAPTLDECLRSLVRLSYPNYEILVIDDGSTDETPQIVERFPDVRYVRQENRGLSAARNVGARLADGEIIAYTDCDCIADEDWLTYLVSEMDRQGVDVIGGPNIPPPNDCPVARCVAVSPGGPSHVMLDDHLAEHVPGCNLACRRDALLKLGGFDDQFRQAGDDVDICWRFIDAGHNIGYAASAVVWHHRRSSVRAYLRQQAGYGRSEAMLQFKHPRRFNALGSSLWSGVIYGEGSLGLPLLPPVIYHGRFGAELFSSIYRQNRVSGWMYLTLLQWHFIAGFILLLGALCPPLIAVAGAMWLMTCVAILREGMRAPLSRNAPPWSRAVVCMLHLLQPIVRAWHRMKWRLTRRKLPIRIYDEEHDQPCKVVGDITFDVYWDNPHGRGRDVLLERVVSLAMELGWTGDFQCAWEPWDLLLTGDNWHSVEIRTATEELGGGRRFTRARARLRATGMALVAGAAVAILAIFATWQGSYTAMAIALVACAALAGRLLWSRRSCRRAVACLLSRAAQRAGMQSMCTASPAHANADFDVDDEIDTMAHPV